MQEIRKEIIDYVSEKIIPRYDGVDCAHNRNHINMVVERSIKLARPYAVNMEMVYVIAAFHDLGMLRGRENHAYFAGQIIKTDDVLHQFFSEQQIETMAEAVEDHSSENKKVPRTIYGKIIAQADRNLDLELIIKRAVGYGVANYPDYTMKQQCDRVVAYVQKKYGNEGRVKLWLQDKEDEENLEKVRENIMNTESVVKKCEQYLTFFLGK